MNRQRILSGVQATGNIHLGNYLGAIKNWVSIQNEYDCFFFLADLHAITIDQDPEYLKDSTFKIAAAYIACGLDYNKVCIFAQSDISQHSELAWIFNCYTPVGWLKRMTQFKDKSKKSPESASAGLFTYPVLMASDILLYNPDLIPVGEDQKQHIELCRDIAGTMNRKFGFDFFKFPEPLTTTNSCRIKSLKDGQKKMSKSDPSDSSRINLSDSNDQIFSKIMKSKTDSIDYISFEPESRPEISNLISIYSAFSGENIEEILNKYSKSGFAKFKNNLAEVIISKLSPISSEYNRLINERDFLKSILKEGKSKASKVASETIYKVKEFIGFINS